MYMYIYLNIYSSYVHESCHHSCGNCSIDSHGWNPKNLARCGWNPHKVQLVPQQKLTKHLHRIWSNRIATENTSFGPVKGSSLVPGNPRLFAGKSRLVNYMIIYELFSFGQTKMTWIWTYSKKNNPKLIKLWDLGFCVRIPFLVPKNPPFLFGFESAKISSKGSTA